MESEVKVTRLDLMDLKANEKGLTLASWCPDNSCTSTPGFYCSYSLKISTNLDKFEMTNRRRMQ